MNRLFLGLLLLLVGCSRPAPWRPPVYKDIEVTLSEYHFGTNRDASFRPNSDLWREQDKPGTVKLNSFGGDARSANGAEYRVEIEYVGPKGDGDEYKISLSHPEPKGGFQKELIQVNFSGKDKELWRDDVCSLGIHCKQPSTNNSSQQRP